MNIKRRIIDILIVSTISIVLLLLIELFSLINLSRFNGHFPYLFNSAKIIDKYYSEKYKEFDPFIGWIASRKIISDKGFKVENNLICLNDSIVSDFETLNILITGGSTSDLIFDSGNWPFFLKSRFSSIGYNANIYIGAIAGYNTGQELLKLIRDGLMISPDIHISYSGANEMPWNTTYVSKFEQDIFENSIRTDYQSTFFMPNTYYTLKSFTQRKNGVSILQREPLNDSFEFYKKNLEAMEAISIYNNYKFIAILQPINLTYRKPKQSSIRLNIIILPEIWTTG